MNNVTPTRPCTVQGSPAFFHRWVTEDRVLLKANTFCMMEDVEAAYARYAGTGIIPNSYTTEKVTETRALVEMLDGSVKLVPAIEIRFTDREG